MNRPHDVGGQQGTAPLERYEHPIEDWQALTDAVRAALRHKGLMRTDEGRRASEDLEPELYARLTYYERAVAGLESILVERGWLTAQEVGDRAEQIATRERASGE
jgi:hypothetical protein